jgi:competence ComEA-like helix-hairpin-helix protein
MDSQKNFSPRHKERIIELVDLNSTTLAELDSLPGVGPMLGERIIKFRDALGGFHSVTQLQECFGMPPETYERIKPRLIIIRPHHQIQLDTIRSGAFFHPYFPKKIFKIHQAYTKHHGAIQHAEELKQLYPPDTLWYEKLLPYLSFPNQ